VTPTGLQVANLRVATKEVWNDKTSGQKQERTDWHRVVAYDRLASICERYLSKGQLVYIEGSLQTRSWDDKETGQKRYMTEIKARDMRMLGGRREGSSPGTAPGGAPTGEPEMPGTPEADDDVPF
jgi:single-strand DNA-binding protein